MMKIASIVTIVLLLAIEAIAGDAIPSKYVGVWATEDSVFNGIALVGGQAVYLDADGEGAIVGAPLPVKYCNGKICAPVIGIKIHATLEKEENFIQVKITDYGETASGIGFVYDPQNEALLIIQPGKGKGDRLKRHTIELSEDIKKMLHEQIPRP